MDFPHYLFFHPAFVADGNYQVDYIFFVKLLTHVVLQFMLKFYQEVEDQPLPHVFFFFWYCKNRNLGLYYHVLPPDSSRKKSQLAKKYQQVEQNCVVGKLLTLVQLKPSNILPSNTCTIHRSSYKKGINIDLGQDYLEGLNPYLGWCLKIGGG